ncbi:MAG: thioesterase [Crocinitomicaceae bacterium]|nr:thioesterase [Crocinitomicaceae bacterium]|tara:strand:+ start:83947 stop:84366 length:420 start_codon:yes stop_codon:yes gene_type:complete
MKLNFKHSNKLRVRYSETDQMGYCYYGNYAQYFEVGRVETLRKIGISYKQLEERGIMLPVIDFHVKYEKPAKYDDNLTIQTKIIEIKGAKIIFEYTIINESNETIAISSTTLAFISKKTMRPITPPKDFIELLSQYIVN